LLFTCYQLPDRSTDVFSIFVTLKIRMWNTLPKLSLGSVFIRLKCLHLTGSAVGLWLWARVHTTYGSYKTFRRVNTHSGWHLNRSDREDGVRVSGVIWQHLLCRRRRTRGAWGTHAAAQVHCAEYPCNSGANTLAVVRGLSTMPWRNMGEWRYRHALFHFATTSRWMRVVSSTPLPLYPRATPCLFNRLLGGPHIRYGCCGEKENLALPRIELLPSMP
jgi:hypothetical protein